MNDPRSMKQILGEPPAIYRVPKLCRKCGLEWDGNSFFPPSGKRVLYTCGKCIDEEIAAEREKAERATRPPEVEVHRPKRTAENYDP